MNLKKNLIITSFFISLVLFPFLSFKLELVFKYSFLLRSIPYFIIAFTSLIYIKGINGKLLGMGLILSTLGSQFFNYNSEYKLLFIMSGFGIGHIMYSILFLTEINITPRKIVSIICLYTYGLLFCYYLRNAQPHIIHYIQLYILLLITMAAAGILYKHTRPGLIVGVLLYVISDSLIGIGLTNPSRPTEVTAKLIIAGGVIVLCYTTAQVLIHLFYLKKTELFKDPSIQTKNDII